MADDRTRKIRSARKGGPSFLDLYSATLVVLEGSAEGSEYALQERSTTIGRGSGATLSFPDDAMSKEHAVFEVQATGVRVRDLGSTNGTQVNGKAIKAAELKHGDKIKLGEHCFQYLLEQRDKGPRTFSVS